MLKRKKSKLTTNTTGMVVEKFWEPDDSYLAVDVVPVQVFSEDGWKKGDEVRVTITIERKE